MSVLLTHLLYLDSIDIIDCLQCNGSLPATVGREKSMAGARLERRSIDDSVQGHNIILRQITR